MEVRSLNGRSLIKILNLLMLSSSFDLCLDADWFSEAPANPSERIQVIVGPLPLDVFSGILD